MLLVASHDPDFRRLAGTVPSLPVQLCSPSSDDVLAGAPEADVIVLEHGSRVDEAIALYDRVRAQRPGVPILLAVTAVDTWLAIELLKLGVWDIVLLPTTPDVLDRKVRRAVTRSNRLVVDVPGLGGPSPSRDKRRAFRVSLRAGHITAVSRTPGGPLHFPMLDLSLPTHGAPGGAAFRVASPVPPMALVAWTQGVEVDMDFELDGDPEPIAVWATVARVSRDELGRSYAVQYHFARESGDLRIRAAWSAEQQRRRS